MTTERASAEKGATPAGAVARQTTKTVEILSFDKHKKAISFRDAYGRWREVSMGQPELEHYLTDLKEGDKVQVTLTEDVAIDVEPRADRGSRWSAVMGLRAVSRPIPQPLSGSIPAPAFCTRTTMSSLLGDAADTASATVPRTNVGRPWTMASRM